MQNTKINTKTSKNYNKVKTNHYETIDGLRAYSAIGILIMHVLANGKYELDGFVFGSLIPSFAD